ncbi:MAG: DUF4249 domain-containing protein [Rhodothermaceae bacterium]|nr:DUF4249 domain-containing protein [Rhodothermaceae bacterium]MXZ57543.1 DUF4249 domain-containing protein [Rhodothermaceae bacterium]MYB90527.1 DUF4249 domain-containing protein [Rhodothermaceae bacterium]MYD68166.1 DUF4249 domain-containing protein [Rhodothermaceae bacterium]MYG44157.1 DUF4249 domain-containing protein [Rhodothermaceae bacterium]
MRDENKLMAFPTPSPNRRSECDRFSDGYGWGQISFLVCCPRFIGLLILLLLPACETVIEIDPPEYDPELSISSNFTPDSIWSAIITQTVPVGSLRDTPDPLVSNATVRVYQGESLIDRLIYDLDRGEYVSAQGLRPRANIPYRMVVDAPGFRSASAMSTAPLPPDIADVEIGRLSDIPNVFGETEYQVDFRLPNRPGLNYYSFFILIEYPEVGPSDSPYGPNYAYMSHDSRRWYCNFTDVLNPVEVAVGDDYGCAIGALSDRNVDEPTLDFEIKFDLSEELGESLDQGLLLVVLALSPEFVEYQASIEEQWDFDGFGQPVNLYTNIEGGRGIFAGYSGAYHILGIPKFGDE